MCGRPGATYNQRDHEEAADARVGSGAAGGHGAAGGMARVLQQRPILARRSPPDGGLLGNLRADFHPDGDAGVHSLPRAGEAVHRAAEQPAGVANPDQTGPGRAGAELRAGVFPGAFQLLCIEPQREPLVHQSGGPDHRALRESGGAAAARDAGRGERADGAAGGPAGSAADPGGGRRQRGVPAALHGGARRGDGGGVRPGRQVGGGPVDRAGTGAGTAHPLAGAGGGRRADHRICRAGGAAPAGRGRSAGGRGAVSRRGDPAQGPAEDRQGLLQHADGADHAVRAVRRHLDRVFPGQADQRADQRAAGRGPRGAQGQPEAPRGGARRRRTGVAGARLQPDDARSWKRAAANWTGAAASPKPSSRAFRRA